jgi:AmiR/NasT family two-component response regulator
MAARNKVAAAAVRRLQERLDMRKTVSRAVGLVAEARDLSYDQAFWLFMKQAREVRRPLLLLARTVILSEETGHLQTISLRRLGSADFTSAAAG